MYLKKSRSNEKELNFIVGHYIIFSNFFCLVMSYEPQTWGPMVDKKLHIIYVCTLILHNPLHLTIGSRLILIQSEFEFSNVVVHILKRFAYV
jgi:hypothetical protein